MNPKVDFYFDRGKKWDKENAKLRKIILSTGLNEELKWGCPCYTHEGANVVVIHDFNEYCAVLFFKGSLLNDAEGVLIQQTKNVQGARQMRFTSLKEVTQLEKTLKAYVYEAIEVERAGLKVKLKETTEFDMPEEFEKKLNKSASLKKAFYKLTPGRQRGYLLFFAAPKLAKTREERVAKYTKHIISGKGLNDV